MNIIRAAAHNRQIAYVVVGLLTVFGLYSLATMPRREDPRITIRTGLVVANYAGATAEQVELQVARPVEQKLFSYAEVKKAKTYTTSQAGAMVAHVELNDDVEDPDTFWSKLRHDFNELRATTLPASVQGPVVNSNFGDVVAVLLTVRGERYDSRALTTYLDHIEDGVRTVADVSKINRYGEQAEEIAVTADPGRLAQYGVTTQQVIQALAGRNAVFDGGTARTGTEAVRLRPSGQLHSEEDVRRVLVATSRTGQPLYIGDVAVVERRYQDPSFITRVDGQRAVLMSIEMHEGRNIVAFGKAIHAKLDELRPQLPPDLAIDLVADQPSQVQHRVLSFGREFSIAVVSVILVTVLLLPFRIAAIAAVSIPVTVAVTIAALRAFGIDLHQISFAALVVALGMVVDDAIVIADNYVELLDHGVSTADAAWRSASELAVPVLGATLTIIASFLPLAFMLPGTVGEFIRTLPLTVSIALACSYAVAMFLTPLLCFAFIKTGLRPHASQEAAGPSAARSRNGWNPLEAMQRLYERVMRWAMPRKGATMAMAGAAFAAGLLMLGTRPQRFFPAAERSQFVVDVWTPEGTQFEATDAVVLRLTDTLRHTPGVRQVSSFTGQGSPRFYYNVNPETPTTNYGQFLVATTSVERTPEIAASVHDRLNRAAPEARVVVKELQQGAALDAPVEVRFSGEDAAVLRRLADSAVGILRATPGSEYVSTNWREERYGLTVRLRDEVAGRVGLTEAAVAQQLAGGLDGAPSSVMREGTRAIPVLVRFDSAARASLDDVGNTYVTSPVTGARVPLREVADIRPEWQAGRIVRRNGTRTITVGSFARPGVLASTVLAAAQPKLEAIARPAGYGLSFGGEMENQAEVQGPMSVALAVSLLAIFLILFLQFRNVSNPLIVMVSIPLALFGASLGLVLTGNPFSFTANVGLTALTGVVVRNAIILVDYIIARRAEGETLEQAALDAGRRRLRPIFLTTMAAAVGVVPLIISGSNLWSPLASVLAVGLVCSMAFTLVVVPVLYVVVEGRAERRRSRATTAVAAERSSGGIRMGLPAAASVVATLVLVGFAVMTRPGVARAQQRDSLVRHVTLDEAVAIALRSGHEGHLARARVDERLAEVREARSNMLPSLTATGNVLAPIAGTNSLVVPIPAGALGTDVGGHPIPGLNRALTVPVSTVFYGGATLSQPVTQLFRLRNGARAAAAAARGSEAEAASTALDVRLGVERLYYGILAGEQQRSAAAAVLAARQATMADADRAVAAGYALEVRRSEARAAALDAAQSLVAADNQVEDGMTDLKQLMGLPVDTRLELEQPAPLASVVGSQAVTDDTVSESTYIATALEHSPEVRAARAQVDGAAEGVGAARTSYIPDIGVSLQYIHQNAVSFIGRDNLTAGIQASWTIFDWGHRDNAVQEASARRRQAEENLAATRDRVAGRVSKAYRAAVRANRLYEAARAASVARAEAARVSGSQTRAGYALASLTQTAEADRATAEAGAVAAELGARLARAELERAVGGARESGLVSSK